MPTDMAPAAQEEWRRVVAILDAENRLSEHDGGLIRQHAICYGRLEECKAIIDKDGLMIQSRDRGLVKNPCVQLERNYLQLYQKGCEVLGVDPKRREAMSGPVDDDPDGLLD